MEEIIQKLKSLHPAQQKLLLEKIKTGGSKYNIFPLSSAQQRMWFLYQMNTKNPFYNICYKMKIRGELSVPDFKKALMMIIGRHEILRARFLSIEGSVLQYIVKELSVDFPFLYQKDRPKRVAAPSVPVCAMLHEVLVYPCRFSFFPRPAARRACSAS